jgi:hypothetical protein
MDCLCAAAQRTRFFVEDFAQAHVASGRSRGEASQHGAAKEREAGTGRSSNHLSNEALSNNLPASASCLMDQLFHRRGLWEQHMRPVNDSHSRVGVHRHGLGESAIVRVGWRTQGAHRLSTRHRPDRSQHRYPRCRRSCCAAARCCAMTLLALVDEYATCGLRIP